MTSKLSIIVMSTILRLFVGRAIMAAASAIVGLKGVIFQVATIQAALPTLITCFTIAKQHNIYPEIISSSIVISTCHFLPVVLIYFIIFQHYP
ncbi:PREDICTED: probable auxin efflux carrier component 1b [Lupinus angustifolius]|uniref:probable auxin efflux carrier component 1b n=1 Tax=Lupinus angustifolius TaxID=3871 RepID=UPI00092EAB77|nr:PREDICTED: probable auxin efflux carrier component 1b [Lupinus angustifolius]